MTITVAAAVIVALLALLWLAQRRLIYLPFGEVPDASRLFADVEEVRLSTEDGLQLGGWFVPVESSRATVIVLS